MSRALLRGSDRTEDRGLAYKNQEQNQEREPGVQARTGPGAGTKSGTRNGNQEWGPRVGTKSGNREWEPGAGTKRPEFMGLVKGGNNQCSREL